ncbi:hypothetical protein EZV62_022989 [Acer yangbiense]|uniref:Uncharacterized protein n=1 Tax=Acer yangbiense TaxID=1000413 RepID=A0A5C7H127_9ROSI|nr:hypothetical protein EZV62_022989 [Acer yangbiense]
MVCLARMNCTGLPLLSICQPGGNQLGDSVDPTTVDSNFVEVEVAERLASTDEQPSQISYYFPCSCSCAKDQCPLSCLHECTHSLMVVFSDITMRTIVLWTVE